MEDRLTRTLHSISRLSLYLIIFLCPLFFLPFTVEALQLPKSYLFYGLTMLALFCFIIRVAKRRELTLYRTPLDWPLLVLWVVLLVSSIVSRQRYLSFFGDFSNLGVTFVGMTLLMVFYWLVVQHFNNKEQVLRLVYVVLVSGALAGIYFILQTFKLLAFSGVSLPAFNLINASNNLFGMYMVAIFVVALGLLAVHTPSPILDIFVSAVMLISGAAIMLIGFKMLWIVVAIAVALLLAFCMAYGDRVRPWWPSLGFIILIIALLMIFLKPPQWLNAALPVEISLNSGVSWSVASASLTQSIKQFLFGSGLGTFGYQFSQFRPPSMNTNFAWNVRFDHPTSSALEWLTTTGAIASLIFLMVVLIMFGLGAAAWIRQVMESRRHHAGDGGDGETSASFYDSPLLFWSVMGAWVALLVSWGFSNWGAAHWVLWWLFTALLVVLGGTLSGTELTGTTISLKTTPQYALVVSFSFIALCAGIVVLGIYLNRFYTAEVVYAKSFGQSPVKKISLLQEAINLNPYRTLFHLTLADTFLGQAAQIAGSKGDSGQVYQSVALAVQAAKRATDNEPQSAETWEFLSTMYANARAVAPDANEWLIRALDEGIKLEPTNPVFHLGRGNAELAAERLGEAAKNFEKALNLKPDWALAALRLALTKEAQGDAAAAITVLERQVKDGQSDAEVMFQLGRYYYNRKAGGDYANAEILFKRALAINPNYSDALYALATLYQVTGNKDLALPLFKRVAELNPGNKEVKRKLDSLAPALEKSDGR